MKEIAWSFGEETLSAVVASKSLWFSTRTLTRLMGTTKQAVSLLARNIDHATQSFEIGGIEGKRRVSRAVLHYPLVFAVECAVRGRRRDCMKALLALAQRNGIACESPLKNVHLFRHEHRFADFLKTALDGVLKIERQYVVGKHFVDFYLPDLRLGIEYDEKHHDRPKQSASDKRRQAQIETSQGIQIIRAKQGEEGACINTIIRRIAGRKNP